MVPDSYAWLAVVAVINTVVSLFYYLRVIAILVFPGKQRSVADLGWPAAATMIVTGVMILGLGLWANGLISLAQSGGFVQFR
jgi:NADH-quinone oxidoreductase subunit N